MRHVSRTVIAAAIWAVFLCQPAVADCVPEAKVRSDVAAWHAPVTVAKLEGAALKEFLAGFNAAPPVSHLTADKLLIIEHRVKPNTVLVLFVGDCARATIALPRATVRLFLQSI